MALDFTATSVGKMHYKLYFICDSYLGADQEFDLKFRVEGSLHVSFSPNVNSCNFAKDEKCKLQPA